MDTLQSPSFIGNAVLPTPKLFVDIDAGEIPHKDDHNIETYLFLGYMIMVGKNSLSNDTLINEHKAQHPNCIWFHARSAKGGHVVLCIEGKKVPEQIVLRRSAGVALEHSKSTDTEVNYAPLSDVYKPDMTKIGVFKTWRQQTIVL